MRKYLISSIFLIGVGIYFNSCTDSRFHVPIEDVEIQYRSHRFDHEVNEMNFEQPEEVKQHLYQKYGDFYQGFVERIIQIGPVDSLFTISELKRFSNDFFIKGIQDDIDSVFTDQRILELDQNFSHAFKRAEFLIPSLKTPEIIYFNSAFNNGIVILEDQLAIGCDFYLGANNVYVSKLPPDQFQEYKREKMDEQFLVFDAVKYWLEIELDSLREKDELLSEIIFKGKIMYLMDAIFPETDDHLKIRYFKDEILWAENNEYNVWLELAQEEVLYNSRSFEIQKWIIDGPFTNAGSIPVDSPPRLGEWIGWQMVKQFMNANKNLTLGDLLAEESDQKILKYYDPR